MLMGLWLCFVCVRASTDITEPGKVRDSLVARITACRAVDRGSIPRRGVYFYHRRPMRGDISQRWSDQAPTCSLVCLGGVDDLEVFVEESEELQVPIHGNTLVNTVHMVLLHDVL
jgi:hypothetical protein